MDGSAEACPLTSIDIARYGAYHIPLEFRLEEAGIVPIINWQARQEEWITTRIRRPQNRRDAIFVPMLHQHIPQLPLEFVARFGKCIGIRKRMDRSASG